MSQNAEAVVQECGVGLVKIKRNERRLAFAAPSLLHSGSADAAVLKRVAEGFGVALHDIVHHQWVVNGPKWLGVMLRSAKQVLSLKPNFAVLGDLDLGVVGAYPAGFECQFELRAFVCEESAEDPVTGSLNAGVA